MIQRRAEARAMTDIIESLSEHLTASMALCLDARKESLVDSISMTLKEACGILGLNAGADRESIKHAFRNLAKQTHPDLFPDDSDAAHRFARLRLAESCMLTSLGPSQAGLRGADIASVVAVPLKVILQGGAAVIPVPAANRCRSCQGSGLSPRLGPQCTDCSGSGRGILSKGFVRVPIDCPACTGTGSLPGPICRACLGSGRDALGQPVHVKVPAGFMEGGVIVLKGYGGPGGGGAPHGDLLVTVHSEKHPTFQRRGSDLTTIMTISFADFCLGATLPIPLLRGGFSDLTIKPGTPAGFVARLDKQGLPDIRGGLGSLFVKLTPYVPRTLSKDQIKVLTRWRTTR